MSKKKESPFSAGLILAAGAGILVIFFIFLGLNGSNEVQPVQKESVASLNDVHGLAIDLKNPDRPYIASHTGLFTVKDGKLYPISQAENDFMGFSTHPTEPGTFFASGHPKTGGNLGYQVSNDGGQTWQKISDGLNGPVDFHALAVSQANPQLVYGWYRNSLQKSSDGGKKWQAVSSNLSSVFSLVSDPYDEQTLYAVTGSGVMVNRDGAEQWTELTGESIIGLAIDPSNNQVMIAASDSGLLKSADGGKSWSAVPASPAGMLYLAYTKSAPATVYAVNGNGLVHRSVDGGSQWTQFN